MMVDIPSKLARSLANADDVRRQLSAAGLLLLDRRARHGAVRTEHAAVSLFRVQYGAATGAFVEELAGRRGHHLRRLVAALRTGQGALQLQVSHRSLSPWPGSRHW